MPQWRLLPPLVLGRMRWLVSLVQHGLTTAGRAACTPAARGSECRAGTRGHWARSAWGSSNNSSTKGPLQITSVRETQFLFPRKSVAEHSVVLRGQQECPSSYPKGNLAFSNLMLFKREKSWSNAVRVTMGNNPSSTAVSCWGWPGAGGSSPGHQWQRRRRKRSNPNSKVSAYLPKWKYKIHWGNLSSWSSILIFLGHIVQPRGCKSKPFVQNTIGIGLFAFIWSTKLAYILSAKTKHVWVPIFPPKNFPSLKKWLFHPFINNLPHSPLGVLVGNENGSLLKGGNCTAVREFKDTLF